MSRRTDILNTLRQMNDEELVDHLRTQRRKLFEIRFQQATGQVDNHRQVRAIHKEIARAMTVQMETRHTAGSQEG
jgi:large subunit ribosomal protein L29